MSSRGLSDAGRKLCNIDDLISDLKMSPWYDILYVGVIYYIVNISFY